MKAINLTHDVVPVSEFKAQAADFLRRIAETGQPIAITQNGRVAAVVMSPAEYDRLTYSREEVEAEIDARLRKRRRK